MSTKTAQLAYRLTPEEKEKLEKIASETKVPAGQIVGILVSEYIAAKEKNGNQVFFPPKFHTFESIKIQEELDERDRKDPANASSRQKAG